VNGWRIVLAACAAVGLCRAAWTQELKTVEFTPFYGYSFSGGLSDDEGRDYDVDDAACYGGMVDIRVSENTQMEFFLSRQETELQADAGLLGGPALLDLDIDHYHFGGTYVLTGRPWQPVVVATVGATHIDSDVSGSDSFTRFSLGIGGGVRFFPAEHFGLYLAGRGLFTFLGGDTRIESEGGALTVEIGDDTLWQAQVQAGMIFAF